MGSLLSNWPFALAVVVLGLGSWALSKWVVSEKNAEKWSWAKYGRKYLPVIMAALGAACSFIPGMPYPEDIQGAAEGLAYYASAGLVSSLPAMWKNIQEWLASKSEK